MRWFALARGAHGHVVLAPSARPLGPQGPLRIVLYAVCCFPILLASHDGHFCPGLANAIGDMAKPIFSHGRAERIYQNAFFMHKYGGIVIPRNTTYIGIN